MKKLLALTLTGLMLTGLATTAFAAETNDGTAGTGIDVKGNYVQGASERTQISADIVWDAMEFTYFDGYPTWNPGTHDYENADYEKGWSTDTKNITVTNHSNTAITASFRFDGSEGIVGSFDKSALNLETAEGTKVSEAPKGTAAFGISGAKIGETGKIGTITVNIARLTDVSTADELAAAVAQGGAIRLTADITTGQDLELRGSTVVDLNGKTLTTGGYDIDFYDKVIMRNGSIYVANYDDNLLVDTGANALFENCTMSSCTGNSSVFLNGTATLKDCTLSRDGAGNNILGNRGFKLNMLGDIRMNGKIQLADNCVVSALSGTYNFDPTSYVDTNTYAVSESGGIWTVSAK